MCFYFAFPNDKDIPTGNTEAIDVLSVALLVPFYFGNPV